MQEHTYYSYIIGVNGELEWSVIGKFKKCYVSSLIDYLNTTSAGSSIMSL